MKIHDSELHKVKDPESFKYKVYKVYSRRCYFGHAEVSSLDSDGVNKIIDEFKESDTDNVEDSGGWSSVTESDVIRGYISDTEGIVCNSIYYNG